MGQKKNKSSFAKLTKTLLFPRDWGHWSRSCHRLKKNLSHSLNLKIKLHKDKLQGNLGLDVKMNLSPVMTILEAHQNVLAQDRILVSWWPNKTTSPHRDSTVRSVLVVCRVLARGSKAARPLHATATVTLLTWQKRRQKQRQEHSSTPPPRKPPLLNVVQIAPCHSGGFLLAVNASQQKKNVPAEKFTFRNSFTK